MFIAGITVMLFRLAMINSLSYMHHIPTVPVLVVAAVVSCPNKFGPLLRGTLQHVCRWDSYVGGIYHHHAFCDEEGDHAV